MCQEQVTQSGAICPTLNTFPGLRRVNYRKGWVVLSEKMTYLGLATPHGVGILSEMYVIYMAYLASHICASDQRSNMT